MQATKEKTSIQEKREALKQMSEIAKPLVEAGQFEKLNEAIIALFYRRDGADTFHTFHQWKKQGMQVKKGSKAVFVWAKPLSAQAADKGEPFDPESKNDFYPLCFLFSNLQVEAIAEK